MKRQSAVRMKAKRYMGGMVLYFDGARARESDSRARALVTRARLSSARAFAETDAERLVCFW